MKHLRIAALVLATLLAAACGKEDRIDSDQPADNIYQFNVAPGHGDSISLSTYSGQVLLVVNTATECGYTPQYTDLERIYETYGERGFTILDFPCNQFGGQAPGSYDDIHGECTGTYNITFPQFAKINVNGPHASPLYVWLKNKAKEQGLSNYVDIQWNFTKFLIDRKGNVVRRFEPNFSMAAVENAIRQELDKE